MGDQQASLSRTIPWGPKRVTPTRTSPSRHSLITALLVLAATGLAGGCASSGKMGDYIPAAAGGLPEGAPARPTTPGEYPAVHEMPPARTSGVLTSAEQKQLEDDLAAARNRAAAAEANSGNANSGPTGGKQ